MAPRLTMKSDEDLHTDAETLFLSGIEAADAVNVTGQRATLDGESLTIRDVLGQKEVYDLPKYNRIFVVGFGKAVLPMAESISEILEDRIDSGVIITPYGTAANLQRMEVIEASHPLPDDSALHGARRIMHLLTASDDNDLVIVLISGGGSALFTMPSPGILLNDIKTLTTQLLKCGASIHEVNVVRKHLSQVKGGFLARISYPSSVVSLIISDVTDDRLEAIASGPTAPDPSTYMDAHNILKKYRLLRGTAPAILSHIEAGCRGTIPDTPKNGDAVFSKIKNMIIANNMTALRAIARNARDIGYLPFILSSRMDGDTRRTAKLFASMLKDLIGPPRCLPRHACIISGGEMTARVSGRGKGGRNQDFCLALVPLIDGLDRVAILSAGTDGVDGNTDAAGAFINHGTNALAKKKRLDLSAALNDYDSNSLLKQTESLVVTGRTRTNVMDIQIVLAD
ncbi:MAG: glycerate kinase [candidate division WOR-3 bacterium]|nr:MAG: glycerate kinase [candidate division WOR-3 bacterium]